MEAANCRLPISGGMMQPAYLRVSVRVRAHVRVDGRNGRWDEGKGVGSLQDNLGGVCVCVRAGS